MEKENGDDYIRRTASFVRTNEQRLADAAIITRRYSRKPITGGGSVFGWIGLGTAQHLKKPLIFTEDPHHLFYLLMRFEALGIDVGSLDVRVENPSRPTSMSYLAMLAMKDKSDVLSISSFRSTMSSVSMFSLGGGWFNRAEPASVDAELKYLYSAFTKVPALRVRASGLNVISELADDPPTDSAIPMDAFKNLQTLECHDIDPRTLMGWDRLSEALRSLTVKRSGLEDVSDLFFDSVVDDKSRRAGNPTRVARPRLVHRPPSIRSRQPSFHIAQLPASVPEDPEEQVHASGSQDPPSERCLPSYAWSLLSHLSLSDNSLTFLPSLPALSNLTSLDLSSNLLVSVPPSLSALPTLRSLNLAHNMIDSVLGIYSQIPSIVTLNLAANRIDLLSGLERLKHLARVDLRDNRIDDTGEIGRLAVLNGMKEVWVSGNPCTRRDQEWRVHCFDLFAKESREIVLDGSPPGIMERRAMTYSTGKDGHVHGSNGRPLSTAHSPPIAPVDEQPKPPKAPPPHDPVEPQSPPLAAVGGHSPALSAVNSLSSAPRPGQLMPVAASKARRRKNKRIVDLDDKDSTDESSREARPRHARHSSDAGILQLRRDQRERKPQDTKAGAFGYSARDSQALGTSSLSRASQALAPSTTLDGLPSLASASAAESLTTISRSRQGAGTAKTLSSTKSSKRRARLSASVYEPAFASTSQAFPERGRERERDQGNGKPTASEAEIFRKRIEALRNEVGDSWLKVLSQTQFGSPEEAAIRGKS